MVELEKIPPFDDAGRVRVVVECPRGSAIKLKHEPALGVFAFGRPLPRGLTFPHDFGFVPGTRAGDGDPLDALVIASAGTYPGVVVACRPLCVLRASQRVPGKRRRVRNDRVVMVAVGDRANDRLRDLSDLDARVREELAAFFVAAVALEDKDLALLGWGRAREAMASVRRSVQTATK